MEINDIRAVLTLFGFLSFCAIAVWAYSGRARKGFEQAESLPFDDETPGRH